MTPPSRRGDPGFGGLPLLHEKTQQRRAHPSPQSNGCAAPSTPAAARRGGFFDRGPCPSQDPGPPPLPRPDPSGSCHPEGDPDLTPDGPGDSRSTGPGCLPCQGPTGRRTRRRDRTDHGPAAQPGGSHAHHRTRTTNTRAGSGTRAGRHRVPVRGRVPHHRSTSAGRRRHRPQHRRRQATARRHADLLRPDRGRRRRHDCLHPNARRRPVQRDRRRVVRRIQHRHPGPHRLRPPPHPPHQRHSGGMGGGET